MLRKWVKWVRRLLRRRRFGLLRARHLRLGRRGEELARRVLCERGLEFLCANFRGTHGELDLVMREGTVLVIAEVKTRHRMRLFQPADAVDAAKRRNILRTTREYLRRIGNPPVTCRYDIVEVIFDGPRLAEIHHLPNAFRPRRR